nr:MAG TPA: hypothetical protein [Caudoviricetes sp.]
MSFQISVIVVCFRAHRVIRLLASRITMSLLIAYGRLPRFLTDKDAFSDYHNFYKPFYPFVACYHISDIPYFQYFVVCSRAYGL